MTDPTPRLEVLPSDLSAYREGNVGIDYVHRFESGWGGPHVLINALTHGNEFCGMVATTHLLDSAARPLRSTLTVSFADVEAYESFDAARRFESRQLMRNMNRVWSDEWLCGSEDSPELRRACALRPVVAAAVHILDVHSTAQDVQPFRVYPDFERNGRVVTATGRPAVHMVMPKCLGSGTPLMQHGLHGTAAGPGAPMVVDCGAHFSRATSELAVEVTLDFLALFGLIAPRGPAPEARPQQRFELLQPEVVKTPGFRFVRPLIGFETFARGELSPPTALTRSVRPATTAPC